MATDQQINANRENAQRSTGPRSKSGKATSSRNALTLGLFTKSDFVRPQDQAEYDELRTRCNTELNPAGILEETLVTAMVSANWLLRRCALVERQCADDGDSDLIADAYSRDLQDSINRARSHASLLLRRSAADLRRLQTDRAIIAALDKVETKAETAAPPAPIPLADTRQVVITIDRHRKAFAAKGQNSTPQHPIAHHSHSSSGSICKTESIMPDPHNNQAQNYQVKTTRNGPCPCGSGEKFKRCCGKLAPPILSPGSNPTPKAA